MLKINAPTIERRYIRTADVGTLPYGFWIEGTAGIWQRVSLAEFATPGVWYGVIPRLLTPEVAATFRPRRHIKGNVADLPRGWWEEQPDGMWLEEKSGYQMDAEQADWIAKGNSGHPPTERRAPGCRFVIVVPEDKPELCGRPCPIRSVIQ